MAEAKTKVEYHWGTGRRKSSVARVRISTGTGKLAINGRDLETYFTEDKDRNAVMGPMLLLDMHNRLDVHVNTHGGGHSGQAGAISQGLARALKIMLVPPGDKPLAEGEPETETSAISKKIRDSGFLTRDGRMKERKKYGRKGARKSFQFSKR